QDSTGFLCASKAPDTNGSTSTVNGVGNSAPNIYATTLSVKALSSAIAISRLGFARSSRAVSHCQGSLSFLAALQDWHMGAQFSATSGPPRFRGTKWSAVVASLPQPV